MNKNFRIINFLILVLAMTISACKPADSTENATPEIVGESTPTLDQELIHLVDHKGIDFQYKLGNTIRSGEHFMMDIEGLIINRTNNEINYLAQSCNGLDYYLIVKPDSYKVMPLVNCNSTWAMISKLLPKDSIKFKTQILQLKDSDPIEKIGIDFRAVDKFILFDTLQKHPEIVDKVYKSRTNMDQVIWSNDSK